MSPRKIHDEGQTPSPPLGKVLGVLDSQDQLQALVRSFESAGLGRIDIIEGEEGVRLLERVHTFFFSDMEERVLNRHIDELKAGNTIVLFDVPSDRRDEAVAIATRHGVRRLVYFGRLTVTWLTA